jgi:hypothetical protein
VPQATPYFLQAVNSEYSDVFYYTKIKWLSVGNVLEHVWKLKKETEFLHDLGEN